MLDQRECNFCGVIKPATREFFGSTPKGTLRGKCRECMNAYSRSFGEANREAQRLRNAQRQIRGGHVSVDEAKKQELLEFQRNLCLCCGGKLLSSDVTEVDHAIPVAKGGNHDESNLLIAHAKCNQEKHAKTLLEHWEWRAKVGLKTLRKADLVKLARARGLL